jgi:hypothetical protein
MNMNERKSRREYERGNIGDGDIMLIGNSFHCREKLLEETPGSPVINELLVLSKRGGVQLRFRCGLSDTDPLLTQEATEQSSVGQQLNIMLKAELDHLLLGASVDHRVRNLVGNDLNTILVHDSQSLRVEIGQGQVLDLSLLLQHLHILQRGDILHIFVVPPMELHQIQRFSGHALERAVDRRFDDRAGHGLRLRDPLCEELQISNSILTMLGNIPFSELTHQQFSRSCDNENFNFVRKLINSEWGLNL